MTLRFVDGPMPTTQAVLDYVRERIAHAIGRFEPSIATVEVRIADVNGPRGGIDKECRILASIPHRSPVIVAEQAGGFYEAIDLASHKLKRAVTKMIDRRKRG